MKISRWIYVPLIFVFLYILQRILLNGSIAAGEILFAAVLGAVAGFVILFWSDSKSRAVSGRDDEEIYRVRQSRMITLLLNYEKAFELCKASINYLHRAKIKNEDFAQGTIKIKTGMNWNSFGQIITLKLNKINEHLTEVEISTRPIPRTALIDYGEGWKYAEEISKFLKEKDAEINKKVLVESAAILSDVYVKPFQKEKVER